LHIRDFNPNSKDFVSFRQKVIRENLPCYLAQLCDMFYEQQAAPPPPAASAEEPTAPAPKAGVTLLYQCRRCGTVYEQAYGDPAQDVPAGTSFGALTAYQCTTCEAPVEDFAAVNSPHGLLLSAV
jgi:rubredoxin